MNRPLISVALLFLYLAIPAQSQLAAQSTVDGETPVAGEDEIDLRIGGVGGVYFLASPGELVIDLEKRDRNRRGNSQLRAILVGPDRRVIEEIVIPDDGQPRGSGLGPAQRVRFSTPVRRKGVYGLNITVSQDRYGQEILWGFRTNCPHYLIETSRGHRDERRQEPIVMSNPDRPGNVCFVPRGGEFGLEVTGLTEAGKTLSVYDATGQLIETLTADSSGRASHTFPADVHRRAVPWRLHLPVQQATIQIDGLTRWERQDVYPDLPCWTPQLTSWFPLLDYRWLLTPYKKIVHGEPGGEGEIDFLVHNNSNRQETVRLEVEFPANPWPVQISDEQVAVGSKKTAKITLGYGVPAEGETRVCHLRATPVDAPDFSTYSTLTVKASAARATQPLEMPLLLKPYQHENEQFGYLPDYPLENQVYFDLKNRPFVNTGAGVATLRDGQWTTSDLDETVTLRTPPFEGRLGTISSKVAFDRENGVYLLARTGATVCLLHSSDGGKTFGAYVIPGREDRSRGFDFEQPSGHNVPDGPPPIVRYTRTATDSKLKWRRVNDLELFVPEKVDGRVMIGEPIPISDKCIGLSTHSGIPSTVVSRAAKVHVAWAEATDPAEKVPGVPTFVASYDRETKKLSEAAFVGYGAPPNDIHNSPSITMDSQGYLHVLAGTHGQPFQYARSLEPNDAGSGCTEAIPVGQDLRQTYIGFVCGADDTLHLVFRMWHYGADPHPASHHAVLAYQRKRPGQPWEAPRELIVSPFSEYSIFYHRLTIDRAGRLFLSYDYWSTHWFYRTDHFGNRTALMMSADGGDTWKLVQTGDFQ